MGDDFDAFRRWACGRQLSPKTVSDYLAWIRRCPPDLASLTLPELRTIWETFQIAPRSRNNLRCALSAWFDFLVDEGRVEMNLAKLLPRLKEKRSLPRPLPPEIVPLYIQTAWQKGPVVYALVVLYLNTGLRLSEVRGIRWEMLESNWIHVPQKGGQLRAVYLNAACMEALGKLHRTPVGWVFPSPVTTDAISKNWIYRRIREVGEDVAVKVWPHRLRHTHATMLYAQTKDIMLVKKSLGHASLQSTQIYTEVAGEDLAMELEGLALA